MVAPMSRRGAQQREGAGASAENPYDLLPYVSMPYTHTQPSRLAAVAALYGASAADPERARVLELGCATGGNILPLAERFPFARFLGVDLSRRQVDIACKRIGALGLANIAIRQADVAQIRLAPAAFDYIICHGLFSWAPVEAQDAILRICSESLSDAGVAVVSYNVLPGWRLRSVVRDLCLRHAGEGSPRERVTRVRAALTEIADAANGENPYQLLLKLEAARLSRRPGAYILGEFLSAENAPLTVAAFAERARAHGLQYVCEADLQAATPQVATNPLAALLDARAGRDRLAREALADEVTGRTFRSAVLRRSPAPPPPRPDPNALRTLHLASRKPPRAEDVVTQGALQRLAEAYPATIPVANLIADVADAKRDELLSTLLQAVVTGAAEAHAAPLLTGGRNAVAPRISRFAQREALDRQPWITSLAHAPVLLPPAAAMLAMLLDGSRNRTALVDAVAAAISRGDIRARDIAADTISDVGAAAATCVDRVLKHFQRNALLCPDAPSEPAT